MLSFKSLFGQPKSNIKKTCVVTPFLTKGLLPKFGIKDLKKGKPYASGNSEKFTLIYTHIGAPFVGDAVLHLNETPCENLILFGSCGAVRKTPNTDLGSIVTPRKAYAFDSFSKLLSNEVENCTSWNADKNFLDNLFKNNYTQDISLVNCATFASFYLEERNRNILLQKGIDVIDMECSAFFHAANHTKRKAIAIFYVTDILKEQHVFAPLTAKEQNRINASIDTVQDIILKFANQQG